MPVIHAEQLQDFVQQMFLAATTSAETAGLVAQSLVNTNLTGHDSHGVVRVPQYIDGLRNGSINPQGTPHIVHETAVLAHVDGDWALGQVAAAFAIETAIAKAKEHGLATAGIFNCAHVGRLGEWTERAARQNMVGLGFCNGGRAGGFVTPFGGAGRRLGTNPIAASFPLAGREPLLIDFATSAVAEGKIRVARNAGTPVAPGLIFDAQGQPSTDPDELYDGGMLLPAAGHKGYGLALMMEMLGGVLTARGCSVFDGFHTGNGVLFIVLAADAFRPMTDYLVDAGRLTEAMLDTPPAPGSEGVLLPGDPERRTMANRRAQGIPLDENTWQQLVASAQGLGVTAPDLA